MHLFGGVCAFALLLHYGVCEKVSILTYVEWFLMAILGSLFPDVDICSVSQRFFYTVAIVLIVFLFLIGHWMSGAIFSVVSLIPIIVRHRGIFHSWLFLLGLLIAILTFLYKLFPAYKPMFFWDLLFFGVGILSHLIFDFKHKIFTKK